MGRANSSCGWRYNMTSVFWSHGHLGWPFFAVLVYSALCLLAGDIIWRLVPAPSRKIHAAMALVWVAGTVAIVALW